MNTQPSDWLYDVASALACSVAMPHAQSAGLAPPYNDLTEFILTQRARMPDYLRVPMKMAALGFDWSGVLRRGKRFHSQPPEQRAQQINAWKTSNLSFQRDFIRYFESLAVFSLYSRSQDRLPSGINRSEASETDALSELRAEITVIGSGPGGAITACLLAEAGRDVLLVEEGSHLPQDSCEPFSKAEMLQKYRNGGQTVAFGKTKIAYVEGRCVGGGSEINSGLYHRTPPEILDRWRKEFQLEALQENDLRPQFEQCERDVSVSRLRNAAPLASLKLHEGAAKLGWKSFEVPRWFRYEDSAHRTPHSAIGKRQSMTETFIPRFLKAGGRLQPQTRAWRVRQNGLGWLIEAERQNGSAVRVASDSLFVCAGAIHTPALLRRSGITQNIGNALQVHPTAKVIAHFPEDVNADAMGVPVHQVKEFSPRLSLGCSVSSPAYLALGLIDYSTASRQVASTWPRLATYYAMITSEGSGTVRTLPGFRDPLVRYSLTETDRRNLADGLKKLSRLLFEAGASKLYPSLSQGPALNGRDCTEKLPDVLPHGLASLMSIHLFSSCPMGENPSQCATNSFGRVHGFKNLFVNDASLLCTAPGVNPQGSIMAIARRNALKFLGKL